MIKPRRRGESGLLHIRATVPFSNTNEKPVFPNAPENVSFYTNIPLKGGIDLRVIFELGEAEDESGLTPGEDDNEGRLKNHRKDIYISMGY